jgi:hypothetical protein
VISFGKPRISACYVSSVSILGLSAYGTAAVGREVDVRRSEHIGETGRAADAFSDSETACALACEPSGNIHSE